MTVLPDKDGVSNQSDASSRREDKSARPSFVQKQRLRDLSIMVTVIGILLLCTALPRIFLGMDGSGEILQIGLAIFGTWLVLILVAFFLSNRLLKDEDSE